MTVSVAVNPDQAIRRNAQESAAQADGAILPGQNVLKAVMVAPREEEQFASTPAMTSWMTANVHSRRKSSYRGAMSSPVLIGKQESGRSAWSPVEKDISTARSGVSLVKID